jgi:hypothetical protein
MFPRKLNFDIKKKMHTVGQFLYFIEHKLWRGAWGQPIKNAKYDENPSYFQCRTWLYTVRGVRVRDDCIACFTLSQPFMPLGPFSYSSYNMCRLLWDDRSIIVISYGSSFCPFTIKLRT